MDFVEQRNSALLRRELEKVYKNEAYFYIEVLDEDLKNLKRANGNSIYDMLKNPAFKEAYFKASTFKVEKIEGLLVYAQAENGKTQIFDLETMTTPGEMKKAKIRGFALKDDDLIINTERPFAGHEEIMVYFNTLSKMNSFSTLTRDAFNVLTITGQLKGPDLISLCSVDTKANTWCDQEFYHRAIQRDFPDYTIAMPMNGSPDYKQIYRELWLPNNYIWTGNYQTLQTGALEAVFYGIQTNHIVSINYMSFLDYTHNGNTDILRKNYYLGLTHEGDFVMKPVSTDNDGSQDKVMEAWNKHEQSFFNAPKEGLFANARQFLNIDLELWIVTYKGEVYVYNTFLLEKYLRAPEENEKPTWKFVTSKIKKISQGGVYALTENGSLIKIKSKRGLSNFQLRNGELMGNVIIRSDIKFINFSQIVNINIDNHNHTMIIPYIDKFYQLRLAYVELTPEPSSGQYHLKTLDTWKPNPEDGNNFQIRQIINVTYDRRDFYTDKTLPFHGRIFRISALRMTNQIERLYAPSQGLNPYYPVDRELIYDFNRNPQFKRKTVIEYTKPFKFESNAIAEFEKGPSFIITSESEMPTMFRDIKILNNTKGLEIVRATRAR